MDKLQKQITELNDKVDRLYGIVERISRQINEVISDTQPQANPEPRVTLMVKPAIGAMPSTACSEDLLLEHKDILADTIAPKSATPPTYEQVLSADLQIRRLTAQLTAAYNRIATLEEQLLACRMHS